MHSFVGAKEYINIALVEYQRVCSCDITIAGRSLSNPPKFCDRPRYNIQSNLDNSNRLGPKKIRLLEKTVCTRRNAGGEDILSSYQQFDS